MSNHSAHEYLNASPTYAHDPHLQETFTTDEQGGHLKHPQSASTEEEDDDLPIHVPDYPTCPWKQVLEDETQVDEWVAARALEFAFTKHGERKPKKPAQEKPESVPTSSFPPATMVVLIDSTLVKPLGRTKEPNDETRQLANAARAPHSPTMQVMESLAASPEACTVHLPPTAVEQHNPPSPLQACGQNTVDGPRAQVVPDSADESHSTGRRGAPQYDSIVEYRCCWSGTYRPRTYENKTGQKRQRAPSTKVGCKARFVIRKVSKTGQFNVTYHWQHNGHDPTNLEQIKRMRSKQLAEPIKEHIRKKNEAASRRDLEKQAVAARRRARQAEEAALAKGDARGMKRKRESLQPENDQGGPMSPYSDDSNVAESPSYVGDSAENAGVFESFHGQGELDKATPNIPEPRGAAEADIAIDPSLDEFSFPDSPSRSDMNLVYGLEHGASAGSEHLPVPNTAQYHHQQMLELVPAPQGVNPGFVMRPTSSMDQAVTGGQQFPPPRRPVTSHIMGHQYQIGHQLPALRSATMQNGFQQGGQLLYGPSDRHSPLSGTFHPPAVYHPSSTPLNFAFDQFRQSVNMAVIHAHGTMSELERLPGRFGLTGTCTQQQPDEAQLRLDMLGITRLAEELAQRVQGCARTLGGNVRAMDGGMPE